MKTRAKNKPIMSADGVRRLSPEDRRNQLLDCARAIIVSRGLSTLTMDLLASEAGVSNPLIYKYFDTRLDLLKQLLVREFNGFDASMREQLKQVDDYRDIVRVFVSANFVQFSDVNIINILLGQPDLRQAVQEIEGKRAGAYLVKELVSRYPLNRAQAEHLVTLGSGASVASAEHYNRFGGDREQLIEDTVNFILGGIEKLVG